MAASEAETKYETAQAFVDSIEQDQGRAQAVAKGDWAKVLWKKKTDEANSLQEGLEAKQALLARAIREQEVRCVFFGIVAFFLRRRRFWTFTYAMVGMQALFVTVFQEFVLVLTERLSQSEAVESQGADESEARPMDLEAAPSSEGQENIHSEQDEKG